MFVCFLSLFVLWRVHQSNETGGNLFCSLFLVLSPTLNTKVKKKETAANFFNHLRKNKEQHTHFIHSYKSRQSE